jgi:hypothetical protein
MIKIFDRKQEYYPLTAFQIFVYLMLADFYTNWVMPPPGVPLKLWINSMCEIMSNFLDIRIAGRNLIANKLLWLCEKWRSEETGRYPTLKDFYHLLLNMKIPLISHTARYRETIINRFEGLFAAFGDHICSMRLMDWNVYLDTDWAISLNGIPTDLQNLFISIEVAKVMMYRMEHNQRSGILTDLFVFDEASTIFKRRYEDTEGTYLLTDYLARAREFGIGFVIGTQSLSNLAHSVMANTAIKVMVGGAGFGLDYDIYASAIGLTPEQRDFLKQNTRPGFACAKDMRYPHPFTMEVPHIVKQENE